jgi:hypothetical protein
VVGYHLCTMTSPQTPAAKTVCGALLQAHDEDKESNEVTSFQVQGHHRDEIVAGIVVVGSGVTMISAMCGVKDANSRGNVPSCLIGLSRRTASPSKPISEHDKER